MKPASIAVLPGDGIGPEVVEAAIKVLSASKLPFCFDRIPCGGKYYLDHGREWPADAAERCGAAEAILLGAVGHPSSDTSGPVLRADGHMAGYEAVLGNRRRFNLYANLRPIRLLDGVCHRLSGRSALVWRPEEVDILFVRENTEGLYAGRGSRSGEDAVDERVITRTASERVIRLAFGRAHRKVTAVAKHNLLVGCGLFVEIFGEVASEFPNIDSEVFLVDAFAQALMVEPSRFDVVVTTNLFGDILTDLGAVLQGGMGMAVGMNLGHDHAMFEPIHGSAPDLVGQQKANPVACILASAQMVRWVGDRRGERVWNRLAEVVEAAVEHVVAHGPWTPDITPLGKQAGRTHEVAAAIEAQVRTRF